MDVYLTIGELSQEDFRAWRRSVRNLTAAAVVASLVGTAIIGFTLALIQAVITQSGPLARLGAFSTMAGDSTVVVLALAVVILTLASLVQSWLRVFDSALVRRRLRELSHFRDPPLAPRMLLSERFLMEGWSNLVIASVQAIGFSLVLIWAGGWFVLVTIASTTLLVLVIARRFFRRATGTSLLFIKAQREAALAKRQADSDPEVQREASMAAAKMADAVYARDTKVFRLPAGFLTLLTIGILIVGIVPAIFLLSTDSMAIYFLTLILWRQRTVDAVAAIGPFAWNLAIWRDPFNAKMAETSADYTE